MSRSLHPTISPILSSRSAWLEFEVVPDASGAVVHQTAVIEPVGLPGLLYWYALLPLHALLFEGLLRAVARRALESRQSDSGV